MRDEVEGIVRGAVSRPLTDDELGRLKGLLSERAAIISLIEAVREQETHLAEESTRWFLVDHPDFARTHGFAWDKCVRDMRFFIRAVIAAMVLDDLGMLARFVKTYYIAAEEQVGITPQDVSDSFRTVRRIMRDLAPTLAVNPAPFELAIEAALNALGGNEI